MEGYYSQRVRDSILPLSVGNTLPKAFEEWSFTNNVVDHEEATEICQLCGQEHLRYHFEIKNALTDHRLWVGSHCILRFGLSVFENGRKLTEAQAKKKLTRLTEQMQQDYCIRALRAATKKDNNEYLKLALDYYEKNKFLTPKFAYIVLRGLKTNQIEHNPSFFKVRLKRDKYKHDLRTMVLSHVHVLWPALTSAQKKMAIAMGHRAPGQ